MVVQIVVRFFYRLVTLRQGDDQDSSQSAYDDVSSLYHLDATTGRLTFVGDRIDPDANANRERIYLEIAIHDSASSDAASEVERITIILMISISMREIRLSPIVIR